MIRSAGKYVFLLVLLVPIVSCTRLPEGGPLAVQQLPSTDSVPLEWGRLVAVSPRTLGATSQLWFEDDSGQIRLVVYDEGTRQLSTHATIIPRS